jgi:hypothetical protein
MRITNLLVLLVMLFSTASFAQDEEFRYTMGYHTIDIKVNSDKFLNRYISPGKDPVCGFYSKYNNTMYFGEGKFLRHLNPEYLYESLGRCIDSLAFDNAPRPYAMMEFDVTIVRVDYETNTIYAKTDGAEIVINTFNKEIDAFYDKFYKNERLGDVHMHLILKNWDYTPESEDSYQANTTRLQRRVHYRGKKAKNAEELLHEVEYQAED